VRRGLKASEQARANLNQAGENVKDALDLSLVLNRASSVGEDLGISSVEPGGVLLSLSAPRHKLMATSSWRFVVQAAAQHFADCSVPVTAAGNLVA
jgi:hypothetical protein